MDTPQPANRYAGSTFAGGRPSFTALPNWLAGKATAFEIAVLWSLQHHYPNICPSLNRIATMSGLSRRTVMGVLNTLERRGWVVREHRQDVRGDSAPNHYVLTIWGEPPSEGVGQEMPHPGQEVPGGRAGDALGVGQEVPPKKNNNNKNNSREELEPPTPYGGIPPAGGTHGQDLNAIPQQHQQQPPSFAGGTVAVDPQPQHPAAQDHKAPSPPKAKRMAASKAFTPTTDDIPAALLPVEAPLRAFWQDKTGQRTQQAWNCLTGALERIWEHPDGGTAAVREQLENATQAGWRSITFANWLKYSQPALAPAGGSRRGSATMDAAQAAIAMYHERGIA
jgi:hypothetical protein